MARICILIPSKNRHQSLARTLPKAVATGAAVMICDQSAEPFVDGAGYRVLHRPQIPSLPAARNCLLAAADGYDTCLFIDDDTDLDERFVITLNRLAAEEPQISAWGPIIETRSLVIRRLSRLAQWGFARDPRRLLARPVDRPTTALFGCCFAVRRAAAVAIGGFAEGRRGYCLGEDLDFCLRLHAAGHRLRWARQLKAWHREDGANRADARQRGAAKARFLVWLARRHGQGNPATLLHLFLALVAAASGMGREPGTARGVAQGLCSLDADACRRLGAVGP